jgi:1,4-dihydroxy-6-naphthoate synthase
MRNTLTLGFSTCPNDTFIFHALVHEVIDVRPFHFEAVLKDVEALNQDAAQARLDVSKLSFAALGHVLDDYALLRSGAALGRGCGPLIVARPGISLADLGRRRVAVPGLWTTACLLLGLYMGQRPQVEAMTFDRIMPAVAEGRCDFGVIIHEGRFTYPQYGLVNLLDLGAWWEAQSGLPIPLGCIAVRRNLGPASARKIETMIRASVDHAFAHRQDSQAYIRAHAQELAEPVIRQHIELYVNDYTREIGAQGERAARLLLERARQVGVVPDSDQPLFL